MFKYAVAWNLRHLAAILKYVEHVYEINSTAAARDHALCTKFAKYSKFISKMVLPFYAACGVLFGCVSLYTWLTTGVLVPPFFIYFPSVDGEAMPNADIPLFVTNVGVFAVDAIILSTCDTIVLLTFCNVPLLVTILLRDLHDIQSRISDGNITRIEIKRRLLKIISMQRKYNE